MKIQMYSITILAVNQWSVRGIEPKIFEIPHIFGLCCASIANNEKGVYIDNAEQFLNFGLFPRQCTHRERNFMIFECHYFYLSCKRVHPEDMVFHPACDCLSSSLDVLL